MSDHYSIEVAPMAQQCLQDIESYKSGTIGAERAAELVDNLLMDSIKNIMEDPERYRFNAHLSGRGLMLRERLDVESEYRVLYDFDRKHIEILLFISMKQDFDKQLYRYNILK
ncbi:type II toxin-antitoxin system RelE/ParE family toxin [Martelella alba]|uniref:Type II toxin-antitoxin system RelE/ParE family toxin n=1 Tax=Martelella alba TaxID=2590451 RepID=A0ABY2SD64_9HYPH|nr:type II toxin-antitoxin system RelE/ParE family toxin [Martelella alba]TKI02148.1 type II toxin-antitoxin system RelE/ParE family toxin [Martelella alba]